MAARKMAFQRLDNLNIHVPDGFGYKKELEKEGLSNGWEQRIPFRFGNGKKTGS